MGNSLRDQMLKAGLVSKGKVKQQKQNSGKKRRRQSPQQDSGNPALAQAEAVRKAKQQRDRALNLEREQAKQRKELRARMRQLLRKERVNDKKAEDRYNFTIGERLKSLYVTSRQRQQLMAGELAIVLFGDSQYLVPVATVTKARALDAGVVVYQDEPPQASGEDADDPYADFKVPDDLIW